METGQVTPQTFDLFKVGRDSPNLERIHTIEH